MSETRTVFVFGDSTAGTMERARAQAARLRALESVTVVDRGKTDAGTLLLVATHAAVEPFLVLVLQRGRVAARFTRDVDLEHILTTALAET